MATTGFRMALGEDEAPWFWSWLVLGMGECCDWDLRRRSLAPSLVVVLGKWSVNMYCKGEDVEWGWRLKVYVLCV